MRRATVAVVAVLAIAVSVCRLWPSGGPRITREMLVRPRACEACGHRFDHDQADPIVVECPKCHKRAGVRVQTYVCRACGHRFEAFRVRPADPSLEAIDPDKPPPELVYRRPGGQWVPRSKLGQTRCPKCSSTNVGQPLPQ